MRAAILLLCVVACGGTKREASAIVGAVDRYRQADNAAKPDLADAIAKVPCTDAEVCGTKDACVAAADPTARGLRLQHDVEQGVLDLSAGKLNKDDPIARALPGKLAESTRLRDQGDEALKECERQVTALRMKYEL